MKEHFRSRPLKPSEVRSAFSNAKAEAERHAKIKILEFTSLTDSLKNATRPNISSVPIDKPVFQPTPAQVWIEEYTPFSTHQTKLSFRNADTCARRLRIEQMASPFFKVLPCSSNKHKNTLITGKVAAGMEICFILEFYPKEVTEYQTEVICCTEREKFAIPIFTKGKHAIIDIPDVIHFGDCPVKVPTTRVMTLHNIGLRSATFSFECTDCEAFRVSPHMCFLEPMGIGMQLELVFAPPKLACDNGELIISDDSGQTMVVQLIASVQNLAVYLSQSALDFPSTYITLTAKKIVRIHNESEYPLAFSWKAFRDVANEEQERGRILNELSLMEEEEQAEQQKIIDSEETEQISTAQSRNTFDLRKTTEAKYRNLRRAALEDGMHFVSDHFTIEPSVGCVWAQATLDTVVTFTSKIASSYSTVAYLDMAGQEERLMLRIRGKAIGPKVKVIDHETLDFGEVVINDCVTRSFTIQNQGEITAQYGMALSTEITDPNTQSKKVDATKITVSPISGTLELKGTSNIIVTFCSSEIGERSELVCCNLAGSDRMLSVRLKATIIPPIILADVEEIDFEIVSFSFQETRSIRVTNTSDISFQFLLSVAEEDNYRKKEFEVLPSSGSIENKGALNVQIRFTPFKIKRYDYHLVLKIHNVDEVLLSIPIKAKCLVPEISIEQPDLDYGECFLQHPHEKFLALCNTSDLDARFEIQKQEESTRGIARCTVDVFSGTILRKSTTRLRVSLYCQKLGKLRLPLSVQIIGSPLLPLAATLKARSIGPIVEITPQELKFGNITCLVEHVQEIKLENVSPISAPFTSHIKSPCSRFSIDQKQGVIPPNDVHIMKVIACSDDTVLLKDTLQIMITNGDTLTIPLSLRGTGSTIWSSSDLRLIDFGDQFSHKECEYTFTLENKGKRPQVLTWVNKLAIDAKSTGMVSARRTSTTLTSKNTNSRGENATRIRGRGTPSQVDVMKSETIPAFTIFPSSVELLPRTACVFMIKGLSTNTGLVTEQHICEARAGKEKINKIAFASEVRANFLDPFLEPSLPKIRFKYVHTSKSTIEVISPKEKPLRLTNVCKLPLTFSVRTQMPFSVDISDAVLQPAESLDCNVLCYPGFKDDFLSRLVASKISISYWEHPKRDVIDLEAEIHFPNLSFEAHLIDFGCIINETQKTQKIRIINASQVTARYDWVFIEDDELDNPTAARKAPISARKAFNVVPASGALQPDESELAEFTFFGHANSKLKCKVACQVQGGPSCQIQLHGEASTLAYKLDKHHLDFGSVRYNKTEERDVTIVNTGKVSLPFSCVLSDQRSSDSVIDIVPVSGKIEAGEKQRILVRVCPGVPECFEEVIWIELAYFEPIDIKLTGYGIFSTWSCTLPRDPDLSYTFGEKVLAWSELRRVALINLSRIPFSKLKSEHPVTHLASLESISSATEELESRRGSTHTSSGIRESEQMLVTSKNHGKMLSAPDEYDIDFEASRILFSEYLRNKNQIGSRLCPNKSKQETLSPVSVHDTVDERVLQTKKKRVQIVKTPESQRTNNNAMDAISHPKIESRPLPFVLSQFFLDFGNVIHGMHKAKKFKLTNIGGMPASLQLDKNLVAAKGFCIEPDRLLRIPEKHSIEITVTFQARKSFTHGERQVSLPLFTKHGPTTLITIRAIVAIPKIITSRELLDFGKVMIGNGRTDYLQLHNVSSVPAEWILKRAVGGTKEDNVFRFSPSTGNLPPFTKANIQIDYEPSSGRQSQLKLTLQVTANSKAKTIILRGQGSELQISFSPSIVELGPILPCIKTATAVADIQNDSEYPVEVISLDFDQEYFKDEELLRSIHAFDPNSALTGGGITNRLRLPPREPGKSMKQYLLELNLLPAPVLPRTDENNKESGVDAGAPSPTLEGTTYSKDYTSGARNLSAIDYIIVGSPQSGKSTQASLLAKKENLNVWTIDEAIDMIRSTNIAGAMDLKRKLQQVNILSASASDVTENQSSDADINSQDVDLTPVAALSQVICWRLCQPDMHNGSVLDGIQRCYHATFAQILEALQGSVISSRVILLNFDERAYGDFILKLDDTSQSSGSNIDTKDSPIDTSTAEILVNTEESSINPVSHGNDYPSVSREAMQCDTQEAPDMQTWSKYMKSYGEIKVSLQKFLAREFRESSDQIEVMLTQQVPIEVAPPHGTTKNSTAASREIIPTSNNFLLEVEFTESRPPLVLLNLIITAMETYIKEIEAVHLKIPAPTAYHLVHRPTVRPSRRPMQDFLLEAPLLPSAQDFLATKSDSSEEEFNEKSRQPPRHKSVTRWLIPSKSSVKIQIVFSAKQPGFFEATLGFEILGSQREFGLFCRGSTIVPSINCDPRNVFMNRVKKHPKKAHVSKKFVSSENRFRFGPLVLPISESRPSTEIGWQHLLDATKSQSCARRQQNVELLRISNATAFVAELTLGMESITNVFSVFPTYLKLNEGETTEVLLCANPTTDGVFDDHLVCGVKDNPEPAVFDVSCLGCVPILSLRHYATDSSDDDARCLKDTQESTSKNSIVVDFDRVLLKRPDTKRLLIENKCAVSIHWRLDKSQLSSDFDVSSVEGLIRAGQTFTLSITFSALNEGIHKHTFNIWYTDKLSKFEERNKPQLLTLIASAEAYAIDVCVFENEESKTPSNGTLDFGLVRIGDIACQNLQLRNRGKFDIKFSIKALTKRAGKLFTIDPVEDVVIPGTSKKIAVQFHSDEEITLQNCKEISCTIIEMFTKEPCHQFSLISNAKAVCSRYRIQPMRGINFGHHRYNESPITEILEIKNDGDFMFTFRILPISSSSSKSSDLKIVSDLASREQSPSDLAMGQFLISPDCGTIDPGITKSIKIIFQPKECRIYQEFFNIEISGCGGSSHSKETESKTIKPTQYEVTAESCYPQIVTNDFNSIFEEQIVVATLGKSSVDSTPRVINQSVYPKSSIYSEQDNTFYFGAVLASPKSSGHTERFKITNPTKVNAQVRFEIEDMENIAGTASSTSGELTIEKSFTVQPSVWDIPPQEYRFINVHFKPDIIMSYQAKLIAQVMDSRDQNSDLTFELRGEGTLPCITVAEPSLRDSADSRLILTFGRVQLLKVKRRSLVLRNDGILTANISLSIPENRDFYLERDDTSAAIAPGDSEEFIIIFQPIGIHVQEISTDILIQVQGNPYDDTMVKLLGTSFLDDVILEDLENDCDTELHFDDVILGYLKDDTALYVNESRDSTKVFSIRNQIADVIRFQWPSLENFSFSPRTGHLAPGTSANITATFSPHFEQFESMITGSGLPGKRIKTGSSELSGKSTKPTSDMLPPIPSLLKSINLKVQNLTIQLEAKAIKYNETTTNEESRVGNWDDQATIVGFKGQAYQGGAPSGVIQLLEPEFESVRDAKSIPIEMFAVADLLRFECSESKLIFQPTYMLQSCTHDIRIENQSETRLSFVWHWIRRTHGDSNVYAGAASEEYVNSGFLPFGADCAMQEECPFEIYPNNGVIQPKMSETFTIRFSPVEVNDFAYLLVFQSTTELRLLPLDSGSKTTFENQQARFEVDVTGHSLRPVCHFDLELSDYAQRRSTKPSGSQDDRGLLNSSSRVIEIESLGVRVRNTRHFHVINTTNVAYDFTWVPEGILNSCFRFITPKGQLLPGKRFEMIVEFTPHHLEPQESFWRFEIPHFQLSQKFLVSGFTNEPKLMFDRGSVNFNMSLIGKKSLQTVYIINQEQIPFDFVFDKNSIDSGCEMSSLGIYPLSGTIPPNGKAQVDVQFMPKEEKSYNFNLICIIRRKPARLSLNIKGEGFDIHESLLVYKVSSEAEKRIDSSDENVSHEGIKITPKTLHVIDFGTVQLNAEAVETIEIQNKGKYDFKFQWYSYPPSDLKSPDKGFRSSKASKHKMQFMSPASPRHNKAQQMNSSSLSAHFISLTPTEGTVKPNDKATCRIHFHSPKQTYVNGVRIGCSIGSLHNYIFLLTGTAIPPLVRFSITSYDFGACFISEPGCNSTSEVKEIVINNLDDQSLQVDCIYEKQPHLRIDCGASNVIHPHESLTVKLMFLPRQEILYSDEVPFIINGTSTVNVLVRGEGVIARVELVKTSMKTVSFGSLQVGQCVFRTVRLINRCKRRVSFFLHDSPQDGDTASSLETSQITLVPQNDITLRPKETVDIVCRFTPTRRTPPFRNHVAVNLGGIIQSLFSLKGSCMGIDVRLDPDTIIFGTVCLGSYLNRMFVMKNLGDVVAKFKWDLSQLPPHFKMSTVQGSITPNQHVTIDILFKPLDVSSDIRVDRLLGIIEGSDPVHLNLVGQCVMQDATSIMELNFESHAREEATRTATIENKTKESWNLIPVMQGEQWSCQENVIVPAGGKGTLSIVYYPMSMTEPIGFCSEKKDLDVDVKLEKQHEGSVFVAVPNGTALLYKLYGRALAPMRTENMQFTIPAKKSLHISLLVKNWLKRQPQTFRVEIMQGPQPPGVLMEYPSSMVLPACGTKTFNMKFYSYTERTENFEIWFTNPKSREYLFYEVKVVVSSAAEMEAVNLSAPLRQVVKRQIIIENPFYENPSTKSKARISYANPKQWWKCTAPQIVRVVQVSDISEQPEGTFEVEYRPFVHSAQPKEAILTLSFVELGDYTYKLTLSTLPPSTESILRFQAPLGRSHVQLFNFSTFNEGRGELKCRIEDTNAFNVPNIRKIEGATSWEGRTASLQVTFEPEEIGEVKGSLVLSSENIGEYKCTLLGSATAPQPQGPLVLVEGTLDIEFRNVFSKAQDFELQIDNANFQLSAKTLTIPVKSSKTITIRSTRSSGSDQELHSLVGKLSIFLCSNKQIPPWIYYIESAANTG
uniref:PREDICTED: similar to hydrocephalus inducing putati n=1 Tax=Albugo laibachii Nc14 TaxID=890382 RepID=F0WCI8_9STRA|nr:PREDICTED: similar to hydrocephalus inducing putati [Albugo laibachii Nc14]|eukprot:CCA18905.1 PREDICTED: similar to hydrocephalus inducing putati [Albugo laibachii Nc14]